MEVCLPPVPQELPGLFQNQAYLFHLLGLLNSSLFTVYVSKHGPIYQGGFRKFSAPYLRNLPIKIDLTRSDRAAGLREQRIGELAESGNGQLGSPCGHRRYSCLM